MATKAIGTGQGLAEIKAGVKVFCRKEFSSAAGKGSQEDLTDIEVLQSKTTSESNLGSRTQEIVGVLICMESGYEQYLRTS